MSYDLAVFDPAAAPSNRAAFKDWFHRATRWRGPRRYDDPSICSAPLRNWFLEMIEEFPALNGPYGVPRGEAMDDPRVSMYGIGDHLIYVGFASSQGKAAYEACLRLAAKHGLGCYDVSSGEGAVWLPDGNGSLTIAHKEAGSA
jgi:hypothetical protein